MGGSSSLVATNLSSPMKGVNATALIRIPFSVDNASECTQLTLLMNYDDGFIAYLNGTEVASANAPATPAWNSTATAVHGWSQAQTAQSFNLANDQNDLINGANMLAIQGLNLTASDPDFLVLPQLQYSSYNINNLSISPRRRRAPPMCPATWARWRIPVSASPTASIRRPSPPRSPAPAGATILYTLDGRTPVVPALGSAETIGTISYSGATATVTTAAAHGYYTGDQVQIAGATPAQYDGVFNISVTGANTFTYTMATPGSNAAGTMTAVLIPVSTVNSRTISSIAYGGTGGLTATASAASEAITTITYSGTTATVTMAAADGFTNSQQVQIAGAVPSQYDGLHDHRDGGHHLHLHHGQLAGQHRLGHDDGHLAARLFRRPSGPDQRGEHSGSTTASSRSPPFPPPRRSPTPCRPRRAPTPRARSRPPWSPP